MMPGATRPSNLGNSTDRGWGTTTRWYAEAAWLGGSELTRDVLIEARDGVIASLTTGASDPDAPHLGGIVLPGLVNAHSHAFHRLLRGRTHRQGGDFWLWRDRMYEAAASLTPESYERIATAVFIEMAMAGVTTVGEFHYVHHQEGGIPYADANEMGHALVRAARRAGMRICLLDAGYFAAGFDDRPLHPVQERFRDETPDHWLDRVESLRSSYTSSPDVNVGLAPHSVRAVPGSALKRLKERLPDDTPIHIHLSEQPSENRECLEATGMTPTGLLEEIGLLGPKTTVVHATHLTDRDIAAIGSSSTRVCYCATTERDLADGIGPAANLFDAGASICVGSDSHAIIDLFEEARGIELHQRLSTGCRGLFPASELARAATNTGAASLGFDHSGLAVGSPADFIVIDPESPRLAGIGLDIGLDGVVFAATAADVTDVFVDGTQIVYGGIHPAWSEAREALDREAGTT